MSTHLRAVDGSDDGDVPQRPLAGESGHPGLGPHGPDAELMDRINRALRSREVATPDAAVVAARIEDRLAALPTGTGAHRGAKIAVAGVVTSTLAVLGAGAAAAADPYSGVARVVENAVQAVGVNWSPMPDGFSRAQWDAFAGAGYTFTDAERIGEFWGKDVTETKALIGQKVLDGELVPPPRRDPGEAPLEPELTAVSAFFDAGYGYEDAEALAALWDNESPWEAKVAGGERLLAGEVLPIPPGGALPSGSATP